LARPVNLFTYGTPDLFDLAASYAHGIIANHPFVDGNKRVAFVAARLFLLANGMTLTAPKEERVTMFVRLAAGDVPEDVLARWFRDNGAPDPEARRNRP
jgi:death-on-curing protein